MGDILGIIGFLGFLVCIIWIVINLVRRKSIKIPAVLLVVVFFVFIFGITNAPLSDDAATEDVVSEEIEDEIVTIDQDEEIELEELDEEIESADAEEAEDEEMSADERAPPTGVLEAHFIDVGQGDSILIKTAEKNILIDGGDRGNTVVNYLRNQGVSSLDLVIGTHPHADHIGGLINVMDAIPVKEIIDPGVAHTTITFEDYLDVIDAKDIIFTEGRAGMTRNLGGGAEMEIIHPTSPSSSHLNNASIVCRVTFGEISFIFTGDAEREAESQILNRSYELDGDILKVGHHGSATSTTRPFLSAVDPDLAVIMCGRDNQYGHPHQETLENLSASNVDIYRTDKHGTVVIKTDGITYEINNQPYLYDAQSGNDEETDQITDTNDSYVGSSQSDRYHYPDCHTAQSINPENLITLSSVEEARAAGYSPCGNCRPQ